MRADYMVIKAAGEFAAQDDARNLRPLRQRTNAGRLESRFRLALLVGSRRGEPGVVDRYVQLDGFELMRGGRVQ
jgi:hypothetical protein